MTSSGGARRLGETRTVVKDVLNNGTRFAPMLPTGMQNGATQRRPPCMERSDPLPHDRRRRHHQTRLASPRRPREMTAIMETGEKGHHLDRLAKAHFIAQDTADLLSMQFP